MKRKGMRNRGLKSGATRRGAAPRKRSWVVVFNALFFLGLCFGVYYLGVWLHRPTTLPLKRFTLESNGYYIPNAVLREKIQKKLSGGFFSFNSHDLRESLMRNQWVHSVRVRKVYPDTLQVRVIERKPVAYWGEAAVLDESGELFTPKNKLRLNLPVLYGLPEQRHRVWSEFLELSKVISPLGLKIDVLRLSARGSWGLRLSNGISVDLGSKKIKTRWREFIAALPSLSNHNLAILSADLRYPSGFAVKWGLHQSA